MIGKKSPEIFTVAEAASYLRLSKATLNRLRCQGTGPSYVQTSARGRVIYRRIDLEDWLVRHTVASTSEAGLRLTEAEAKVAL